MALFIFLALPTRAVHVWGGELEASCDGSGNYTLRLSLFVDCGRVAGMPGTESVQIYDKAGTLVTTATLTNILRDTLPTVANACANEVAGTCIGRVIAEGTVSLASNLDGYTLAYGSCCRNSNINNIVNPGGTGQIYTIELPGTKLIGGNSCNSAPTFNALPPSEICTNLPTVIDFSATDSDGDQLKYKFFNPYGAGSGQNNNPPPFPEITFTAPYSFDNPMNSGLTIDENTGIITGTPTTTGLFALGVVVEEYRNGKLIGTKVRDYTYTVVPCTPSLSAGEPSVLTCANDPVQFGFTFSGILAQGTTPIWDFGDPASGPLNSSTDFNPTHQYSALGTYTATVSIQDSCGNTLQDVIRVDIVESVAEVEDPGDVCIGDDISLVCKDVPCNLTEWYADETSTSPIHVGCTYDFTLVDERKCVYFEPFVDPNLYTVGANAEQGWGTDVANSTGFEAISALTISGFTLRGDQYWNGCTNFAATVSVMQGGNVIAGPENVTIDCDGESVFSGLSLDVPPGTGYELVVNGATVRPGIGGPVNQIGLITVNPGGPFYNIEVSSNKRCARRDSICMVSDCPCPDTTLQFPPNFCANQTYNLNELLTSSTSAGTWSIKTDPGVGAGTITNDTIFDANSAAAGNYTFLYTITGTFDGCVVENERTLEVYSVDSASIPDQGPFCTGDGNQNINLSPTTTTGGTWSASAGAIIDASTGEFDPAASGIGKHWIYYDSPSANCPARDSVEIEVTGALKAEITTNDTSICQGSPAFVIKKSSDSNEGGIWSGSHITDSLFDPTTAGEYTIKYAVSGLTAACSDSDTVVVTVVAPDTASITPNQGPFCLNDGPQTITTETDNTPGGTWSSSSVGAIDANTGELNLITAGVGTHWVYYDTPGTLCPDRDSIEITITEGKKADIITTDTSVCTASTPFVIRKSADSNEGGTWTGSYITDSLFDPSVAGVYTIKYSVAGLTGACSDTDSVTITVITPDTANITPDQGPFCTVDGNFTIQSEANQTAGGTWSTSTPAGGINATTGEVDPTVIGTGFHWIFYHTSGTLCPDVDSIQIEVTPAFEAIIATPDTSLCYNASSFNLRLDGGSTTGGNWSGNGLSGNTFDPSSVSPGEYSIKYSVYGLTSACSDSDSVTITVLPPDTVNITPDQGPFCRLGPNDTITFDTPTNPGIWSSNTATIDGNSGELDPTASGSGMHWIYYTTSGTCSVVDSIEIEIIDELKAIISTLDTTVCANSSDFALKLHPTSFTLGSWSGTGVSGSTFSPTASGEGTFKVFYDATGMSAACSARDSIEITVLPNEDARITPPSPNQFCVGDPAIDLVTADQSGTGTWWTEPAGLISPTGTFTPTAASVGTTHIFYGVPGMCGDTSSASITVHGIKDPSVTQLDDMCEIVDDMDLKATEEGKWTINGLPSDGTFSPTNLGPGIHEVINFIDDHCPVSDTMYVHIHENPEPEIGADTLEGCHPLEVNFEDLTDSNAITTKWTIEDAGTEVYSTFQLDSLKYQFTQKGCYDIKIESTFDYGCKNTATLPYQVCTYTPPNADFIFTNTPYSILDPKVYTENQSINGNTFEWKFGSGRPLLDSDNNLIVEYPDDKQDTVEITLVASNGWCSDSVTKSTIIWDYYSFYIPNAFTPNGDGLNEVFFPLGKNHTPENYQFLIYDRWGDRIWETTVPYEGWDGTYKSNGKPCQIDTYIWKVVSFDQYKDKQNTYVGIVNLIR